MDSLAVLAVGSAFGRAAARPGADVQSGRQGWQAGGDRPPQSRAAAGAAGRRVQRHCGAGEPRPDRHGAERSTVRRDQSRRHRDRRATRSAAAPTCTRAEHSRHDATGAVDRSGAERHLVHAAVDAGGGRRPARPVAAAVGGKERRKAPGRTQAKRAAPAARPRWSPYRRPPRRPPACSAGTAARQTRMPASWGSIPAGDDGCGKFSSLTRLRLALASGCLRIWRSRPSCELGGPCHASNRKSGGTRRRPRCR